MHQMVEICELQGMVNYSDPATLLLNFPHLCSDAWWSHRVPPIKSCNFNHSPIDEIPQQLFNSSKDRICLLPDFNPSLIVQSDARVPIKKLSIDLVVTSIYTLKRAHDRELQPLWIYGDQLQVYV